MTREEKAKAYDEAVERAKTLYNSVFVNNDVLEQIFPELKESESDDERIRKAILEFFKLQDDNTTYSFIPKKSILAWLEKQKENPKSADSISSDCVSDAKCENRWHKVGDSLPDSTREVICKDAIGNFFIGRYYKGSDSWEVSMYDDVDKSNEDNPPVVMWCDIPSEKQKDYRKLYEDIDQSGWFKKEYVDKCLGEDIEQEEQKPINNSTREKIISRATSEKQVVLISESNGEAEIGWDTRSLEDAKRLLEYGLAFINKNITDTTEKQKDSASNSFDDVWNEEDCEEIIAEGQKLTPRFKELLKEVCHAWYDRGVQLGKKQQEQAVYKNSKSEIDFADKYSHDVWEKLMSKFNSIEGYSIGCNDVSDIVLNAILNVFKWKKEQKDNKFAPRVLPCSAAWFEDGEEKQKEQKPSINIDQLKSMMLQYLLEVSNEKDDSAIEADTDKWARMILRYDFEQKPTEWSEEDIKIMETICKEGDLKPSEKRWLKSLRPQLKQEWSDDIIRRGIKEVGLTQYQIDWLKSNVFPPKEEQKPAEWSEEDKDKLNSIERLIISANARNYLIGDKEAAELQHFIRSIVKPTTNLAEWSEEDKFKLEDAITGIDVGIGFYETEGKHPNLLKAIIEAKDWLKSLPERFNLQPKNEWTEEDEHRCKDAIYFLETAKKHYADTSEIELTIEWLKLLRPQSKDEIHKEKNEKPKHTEVWVEGRTIFEQDANTFVNTEGKPEAKLTGWVARDKNGEIYVYGDYPERISAQQFWFGQGSSRILDQKSFPDLKWEDEPVEVEITIREK